MLAYDSLLSYVNNEKFGTILVDPPWRFINRTGRVSPEHRRLFRYETMSLNEIINLPIEHCSQLQSHLYLWVPNALVPEGIRVMKEWGFTYKSNLVWCKVRKDGEIHKGGVGFYFRNATELVLFGIRGKVRTSNRTQVNVIMSQKREHSQKPDEIYDIIESCSPGPHLELFARYSRLGWAQWGDEMQVDLKAS